MQGLLVEIWAAGCKKIACLVYCFVFWNMIFFLLQGFEQSAHVYLTQATHDKLTLTLIYLTKSNKRAYLLAHALSVFDDVINQTCAQ